MTTPVMIVDDDDDLREMLSLILDADGYEPLEATDGIDALDKLAHGSHPSLILLDLRMPRMNGTEFLTAVRDGGNASDIPIVALTGDVRAGNEALRAGATAVLPKPFDKAALLAVIHSRLRS